MGGTDHESWESLWRIIVRHPGLALLGFLVWPVGAIYCFVLGLQALVRPDGHGPVFRGKEVGAGMGFLLVLGCLVWPFGLWMFASTARERGYGVE